MVEIAWRKVFRWVILHARQDGRRSFDMTRGNNKVLCIVKVLED